MFRFSAWPLLLFLLCLGACQADSEKKTAEAQNTGQAYESAFRARADTLLGWLADEYAPNAPGYQNNREAVPDPEKYNWPAVIARMEKYGLHDTMANRRIRRFRDNSPFHFTLVGMARIMPAYAQAPAMKKYRKKYLREVFRRDDSFNALTGEGTENHVSMARTSGYLYAEIAEKYYAGQFPQAKSWQKQLKKWIRHAGRQLYHMGNAEWNSSIYGVYNLIGWLNLYDFARDPEVQQVARAALDFYATELALHYRNGLSCGPESRGAALKSNSTNTDLLNWLWFGASPAAVPDLSGNGPAPVAHAATSSYRPPQAIRRLAQQKPQGLYRMGRPTYRCDSAGFFRNRLFVSKHFTLGSCINPYAGVSNGSRQYLNWKLTFHPNDSTPSRALTGKGRYYQKPLKHKGLDPYTQLVQHRNTLLVMVRPCKKDSSKMAQVEQIIQRWRKAWRSDMEARFPSEDWKPTPLKSVWQYRSKQKNGAFLSLPQNLDYRLQGGNLFLNLGQAYALVLPFHPAEEPLGQKQGRRLLQDTAGVGRLSGYALEAVEAQQYENFQTFVQQTQNQRQKLKVQEEQGQVEYQTLSGDQISATFQDSGQMRIPCVDWGIGPREPQVVLGFPPFQVMEQPAGPGFGRVAAWSLNGQPQPQEENWPLFKGPGLSLKGGKLKIKQGRHHYQVDYGKALPRFPGSAPSSPKKKP